MPEQYTTLDILRGEVLAHVSKALDKPLIQDTPYLSYPPEIEMGEIAFGCFTFAKEEKKSPEMIAKDLSEIINGNIEKDDLIERAESAGPYINFQTKNLAKHVLEEIEEKKDSYGKKESVGKTVLFEFSQPNTHKSFHVGHLRGTTLGQTMVNIYRAMGYDVIPINYSGDVGAHIEKILWMMEKNNEVDIPKEHKTAYLGGIYAVAERAIEKNEKLKEEVDDIRKRLEEGDKKLTKLWKETRQWSIDELETIYKELGVTFDRWYFESEVEKKGQKIVEKMVKDGIAEVSEGATIVNLEKYDLDIFVILRSDGTPLYSTKEFALSEEKVKDFDFDEAIVQTDVRQILYFKQFFKTLELMGVETKMTHEAYNFVNLPSGAMSSRKGNVVTYENLRDDLEEALQEEILKRHADWNKAQIKETAKALALATLKFEMLKIDAYKKITFDIKRALSFDGFTASYILYSVARINSVLKKAKIVSGTTHYHLLKTVEEKRLVHMLLRFPEVIEDTKNEYNPAKLVMYLFELTKNFSSFYHAHSVLDAESEALTHARLGLLTQMKNVITSGLALLGIETVEEM